jgi:hypothetical protein
LRRLEELLLRGVTWAMVGVLFGSLFVLLVELLRIYLPTSAGLALAVIIAAALTSLFYGSMRLTLLVANFTFVATLVYTWLAAPRIGLEPLMFVGAGIGVAVGVAYGLHDKRSRVFCADAKIVAGAFAGIVAAGLALLAFVVLDPETYTPVAILVTPLAILVYIKSAGWFIKRCQQLLPAAGDGAVVGLGVGIVTGLVFLTMAASLDPKQLRAAELVAYVERVEEVWMATVAGCALACFPIGALRAFMKLPWYDH